MGLGRLLRRGRALGSKARRALFPEPELSAWRKASRLAEGSPRYTRGTIRLFDYQLEYVDLLTLCPQWEDIFVRRVLEVRLNGDAPYIVDCGANLGLATLYFKKRYPGAKVTAFEADPRIFSALRENLRVNGASDVEAIHAAVWTTNGETRFVCEGADSGAIEGVGGIVRGSKESVPAVRLRDLLSSRKVTLLKLDIEGAEEEVLLDCQDVLGSVEVVLAEVHEFDPDRRRTPTVLGILEKSGFTVCMDDLTPLPWREPLADEHSPFPGLPLCWASLVRAWRA